MFAASILRPLARKQKEKPDRDRTGVLHHALARIGSEVAEWRRRSRDQRGSRRCPTAHFGMSASPPMTRLTRQVSHFGVRNWSCRSSKQRAANMQERYRYESTARLFR